MTYKVSGIGGSTYTGTSFSDAESKRAMGDMRSTMSDLARVGRDMQTSSSSLSSRSVESSRYVPYCSGGMSLYDRAKQEHDWKQKRALNGTGEYKGMPLDLRQAYIEFNEVDINYMLFSGKNERGWGVGRIISEGEDKIHLHLNLNEKSDNLPKKNPVRKEIEKQIAEKRMNERAITIRNGLKANRDEQEVILKGGNIPNQELVAKGRNCVAAAAQLKIEIDTLNKMFYEEISICRKKAHDSEMFCISCMSCTCCCYQAGCCVIC